MNTWKVKASQYCPLADEYKKKKLSDRFHVAPGGVKIQRDCFSAWLIKNVNKAKNAVDRKKCLESYEDFYRIYKKAEDQLRSSNKEVNS